MMFADVDECATNNGGCSHRCVNDPGGFHCECPSTHFLDSDGRTCAQAIVMPRPVLGDHRLQYSLCSNILFCGIHLQPPGQDVHIPLQVKQARMRNSPSYEIILFPRELDFFSSTAKLPGHNNLQEPLPLVRAASRCYAPCDTVSWLSRKVKQLGDQLRTTQAALKKLMDNPILKGEGKLLYFYDCFVFF